MSQITEAESALVRALGEVWNDFLKLPQEHPMDRTEFCSAIHQCQEKILSRTARRQLATMGVG